LGGVEFDAIEVAARRLVGLCFSRFLALDDAVSQNGR